MLLSGQAVIVTGAGSGLGRAYALACSSAGARVVVNDVNASDAGATARLITESGGEAITCVGSVAHWRVAESAVERCVATFGSLDGLVNNAGIIHHAHPWDESEEQLRNIVDVNVLGTQFFTRHTMATMVHAGSGGSIVNIVSGAQFGIPRMSAYGATKGAVTAMTRNWALAGTPHNIRVNAVSPLAHTRMAQSDPRNVATDFAEPSQIAPLVVALLSSATVGVTGQILRFDGTAFGRYVTTLTHLSRGVSVTAEECIELIARLAE